jgi:PhoPQ-activated pathogenicity-related protein
VSGASKEGWTTYLTAAVDKRVKAICPIVMDMLKLQANVHHMWRAYGGWTFAFQDYWQQDVLGRIDTDAMAQVRGFLGGPGGVMMASEGGWW